MAKKKIMLITNPPWLKTGLAENGKYLAEYLEKLDKYEIIYYCQQVSVADPHHAQMPWKSLGCIPADQQTVQQLQQDQNRMRWAAYGNLLIDNIVNEIKPDIIWASDDTWSFPDLHKKSWSDKLNLVYHITVDSKPILPLAYEQAKMCKNFFTWAKFASEEMKLQGKDYTHVKQIYGMSNNKIYSPITKEEKSNLRKEFNLNEKSIIIGYVFRNQLRKSAPELLMAYKEFRKENPFADVKLHLHTSVSEMHAGWDFPRLIDYYKINKTDILFTYYCKNCKRWEVKPYTGEDLNCRYCGAEKSVITPNIADGVADDEMRYIYGLWDASVSPITSGGMEYHNVQSLLCGLPLASTNYSSGEDFAAQSFVYSINWHPRGEAGTSFTKSSNDINSIKNYIAKMYRISQKDREEIGEKGREWAIKTFSVDTIGKQWENVFDSLPNVDTSKITLDIKLKNDSFANPNIENEYEWLKSLYKNILLMDVQDNDSGLSHWINALKAGKTRQEIYNYFLHVAREENGKVQKPQDFGSILDKDNGRKRALFVIKESIGDIIACTQLFESFHDKYPNTDLYCACDSKYIEILQGNELVHKFIPYQSFMESEMNCIGAGQNKDSQLFDYYYHPGIITQRQLQYLSS